MPTKNSTTTEEKTTANKNGSKDELVINDDDIIRRTYKMGGKVVRTEETTYGEELRNAGARGAAAILEDMIDRRWYAIDLNLRGLVELIVNELDEHGLPINKAARKATETTSNGDDKVYPMLNPRLMKLYDGMFQEHEELTEISRIDHEPVSESNTYESWRKRL